MSILLEKYKAIALDLKKKYNYRNIMEVPKLLKIVLNRGLGKAVENKKLLETSLKEFEKITGQKPVKTLAKKSISNFKTREGYVIGCKVTLRGKIMYDFLHKLIHVALPRVRDFQGLSIKSFDGRGNYSIGIKEQIIFPEIDYNIIDSIFGLDICIVTSSKTDDEAKMLLKSFKFPFKK